MEKIFLEKRENFRKLKDGVDNYDKDIKINLDFFDDLDKYNKSCNASLNSFFEK